VIKIRPFVEDDRRFCVRSFAMGYARSPFAKGASTTYLAGLMGALLDHPDWTTLVYADGDVILSWIVFARGRLGWVQTRKAFRARHMAGGLVSVAEENGMGTPNDLAVCTNVKHIDGAGTPDARDWLKRLSIKMRFRPYLLTEAAWEVERGMVTPRAAA